MLLPQLKTPLAKRRPSCPYCQKRFTYGQTRKERVTEPYENEYTYCPGCDRHVVFSLDYFSQRVAWTKPYTGELK